MDCPINIRTSPRTPLSLSEQQTIKEFWRKKQEEIEAIEDFGEHTIPVTCLKKVICAKKGKMMMTSDTPTFMTKACKIFVQELSLSAWMCANSHNRSIVLDSDIAESIASIESYGFLNDVLCAHLEKYKSDTHLQSIKNPHHNRAINQSPTYLQPLSHQYQMTQFIPQSTRYCPFIHIPPTLPQTNAIHMHLPLPLPPITYMTKDLVFFGKGISNNDDAIDLVTPPQLLPEALSNIPNKCYMCNIASTDTYCVGSAKTCNFIAEDGDMVFHFPYVPSKPFQLSTSLPMTNGGCSIYTDISELNHIKLKVKHIENSTYGINPEATFNVIDGQQHAGDETTAANHMHSEHGELDAEFVTTTNANADDNNINWDEVDMASDSMLMEFWRDVMMKEDPTSLPDTISTNDTILDPSDMLELEGCCDDSYLLDDVMSNTSNDVRHG
jgi:nuclear transcription factor Y, gamma